MTGIGGCRTRLLQTFARLRCGDDRSFYGAFWEMYCHETLIRLGYEVECHPDVGVSRRPDYLARKGSIQFVLEATVASKSDKTVAADKRQGVLYDAINDIESPNFFLGVTIVSEGAQAPPASQLKVRLREWMESLDPDRVIADWEMRGPGPERL